MVLPESSALLDNLDFESCDGNDPPSALKATDFVRLPLVLACFFRLAAALSRSLGGTAHETSHGQQSAQYLVVGRTYSGCGPVETMYSRIRPERSSMDLAPSSTRRYW